MNLICADCLDAMQAMPEKSVDAIVTDPPYGLEFMGKEWDRLGRLDAYDEGATMPSRNPDYPGGRHAANYGSRVNRRCKRCGHYAYSGTPCKCGADAEWDIQPGQSMQSWHYAWAVEALRVAKPGAHLLAFGGTRTWHRLACALEDAGWEIRDTVMWVYGSGFPKSHDISKAIDREAGAEREVVGYKEQSTYPDSDGVAMYRNRAKSEGSQVATEGMPPITAPATPEAARWQGWGTALKPAWEPIIVARKPVNCTVAENVLKWGTGGINVDSCRIGADNKAWGSGNRDSWREAEGRTDRQAHRYGEPDAHPAGRWPANLIHDGSDEAVRGFPQSSVTGRRVTEHKRTPAVNTPFTMGNPLAEYTDSGSAARFFYCAKASKQDRDEGCEGMPYHTAGECTDREEGTAGLESPRAGAGRTNGSRNHHPTVKPTALMRYLCRLVTPPGGTVLDPFAGSGSTGKAAVLEGFEFVGIEKDAEYCEIARARIAKAQEQMEERLL